MVRSAECALKARAIANVSGQRSVIHLRNACVRNFTRLMTCPSNAAHDDRTQCVLMGLTNTRHGISPHNP